TTCRGCYPVMEMPSDHDGPDERTPRQATGAPLEPLLRCPFCDPPPDRVVWTSERVVALWDLYPVSPGHLLILPLRHIETYFDADPLEQEALWKAVGEAKALLDRTHAPHGYNVGFNAGAAAGQTVMHLHLHVIPRYLGDVPDPRGGVRYVIPARANY